MKQHRYRITVDHLSAPDGAAAVSEVPLQFETGNHDDIFAIVERMRRRGDFDDSSAAAFAVGLKLFGEVLLENGSNPLFSAFRPHFAQFMKELKKGAAPGQG